MKLWPSENMSCFLNQTLLAVASARGGGNRRWTRLGRQIAPQGVYRCRTVRRMLPERQREPIRFALPLPEVETAGFLTFDCGTN